MSADVCDQIIHWCVTLPSGPSACVGDHGAAGIIQHLLGSFLPG